MTCTVLLSTYNGEKYLREQIDSLLNQKGLNVSILVRDDGSTDSTHLILRDYSEKGLLTWYTGPNLKPALSFLDLARNAFETEYYAFCDQDDVWLPDKLSTAIKSLESHSAELYYSSFTTVDSCLNIIKENEQHHGIDRLGAALINMAVTGCTMVFSNRLLVAVNRYSPKRIMMHDSWLYKIALALDYKVIYDPTAHIYYRQHENNVIGAKGSIWKKWKSRYNRWFNFVSNDRYNEALDLYDGYKNFMTPSQLSVIEPLIGYQSKSFYERLRVALLPTYRTGVLSVDISFVLSFIAKKY